MTETVHSGSHLEKIIKKAPWYFLSSLLTKAFQLFLIPIYTRYLTPADYGVLSTLTTIIKLMPIFISLYLDSAYTRFYYENNTDKKILKRYISTFLWFTLLWGLIVVILGLFLLKETLASTIDIPFYPFIPLTVIPPLFIQLRVLYFVYLKMELKAKQSSLLSFLEFIVQTTFTLLFLIQLNYGVLAKLYANLIYSMVFCCIYLYSFYKKGLVGFLFDKRLIIYSLAFSIPMLPNILAGWITDLSDRIIISLYKNTKDTGIYSIGYELGRQMSLVFEAIFAVYGPIMLSMLIKQKESAMEKVSTFFSHYFLVLFWLAFGISFFSKELIYILTTPQFYMAYLVTPVIAIAFFFGGLYKPFISIIMYHKKLWIVSAGAIFQAVSNIILNLIFIPIYGMMAASFTTLISMFIYFLWIAFWSQKFDKITIPWKLIGKTVLLVGSALLVYFCIKQNFNFSSLTDFIVKCFFYIVTIGLGIAFKIIDLSGILKLRFK